MITYSLNHQTSWRFGVSFIIALLLYGCSKPPLEEQLSEYTRELISSIETMDTSGVLSWLHEDFQTQDGKGKDWVQQIMTVYRLRQQSAGVTVASLSVEADNDYTDQATVMINAALTSTHNTRFLPDQGQVYRIRLTWRDSGGDWQIIHADWEKLLP